MASTRVSSTIFVVVLNPVLDPALVLCPAEEGLAETPLPSPMSTGNRAFRVNLWEGVRFFFFDILIHRGLGAEVELGFVGGCLMLSCHVRSVLLRDGFFLLRSVSWACE